MYEKILLASDGMEYSLKAAEYALQLAKDHGSQVSILYVIPLVKGYWPDSFALPDFESNEDNPIMNESKEIMMKTEKIFADQGVPYTTKITVGDPAGEILNEAEAIGADVIVMGNQQLTPLQRASRYISDSASSKVTAHAHCAVLIVR